MVLANLVARSPHQIAKRKMIHTHHVVFKCQGGTDDPSNLVELDHIEHATLHALEYLRGGPSFDFRQSGWPYLSEELQDKIKEEHARRCSKNRWWTNGSEEVWAPSCPEGWRAGQSDKTKNKKSEAHKGILHKEKSKKKISEALRGDNNPAKRPEVREKMSKAKKGVPKSAEHRANISKGKTGVKRGPYKKKKKTHEP